MLRKREKREELGLVVVEGRRECLRALRCGLPLVEAYVDKSLLGSELEGELSAQCPVFLLDDGVFEKVSVRENGDGAMALAKIPRPELPKSLRPNPLILLCEAMEKPGNVGALLRTADAVGCSLVIIADALTDLWNPNAIRASQGAIFSVPAVSCGGGEALDFLRANGVAIVGTSPAAEKSHWDSMPAGPVAIAVGNEHGGLSDFWLRNADVLLRVPMFGRMSDSLNVATAAAICLYEVARVRALGR
jgi:TrmH family RNA methyltransferase